METILERAWKDVDESLISAESRNRLRSLAARLPEAFALHLFGFESELIEPSGQIDFGILIKRRDKACRILAGLIPDVTMPPECSEPLEWRRIARFCRWWHDTESAPYGLLQRMWMEFDLFKGSPTKMPAPSIFLRVGECLDTMDSISEKIFFLTALIEKLQGHSVPAVQSDFLNLLVRTLPPKSRLIHLGIMLGRNRTPIRLVIGGIPEESVGKCLKNLNIQGDTERLQRELRPFSAHFPKMFLAVDVLETIMPNMGVELYPGNINPLLAEKKPHSTILDDLRQSGVCTPEKCVALGRFPGRCYPEKHDHWSVDCHQFRFMARGINHYKINMTPHGAPVFKAYLWVGYSGEVYGND